MARVRIVVSFELPEGASREDALAYVVDAVATMKGAYSPNDPIFYLEGDTVQATTAVMTKGKRETLRCA